MARKLTTRVYLASAKEKGTASSGIHFSGLCHYDGLRSEPFKDRIVDVLRAVGEPHPMVVQDPRKLVEMGTIKIPML